MEGGNDFMSRTVDNRVVEMGFDNKQFESGVQTSLTSLDKLKKGLNLDESSKSLSRLSEAGKLLNLSSIGDGVTNISSKFSALGVIGFTVLQNLTTAAIDFGRKMVTAVLNPMRTGLSEYETQMNAIQTVLANTESKGTTLEDVNKALDELNTYADKTIYNFSEMTKNIGTFTAAGVDLDTATAAIKGIANLAAISGSNSQQASTAMYQLSQAMASGTVKLMDWNSVVNAGMGGQVFQDALKETARVSGIAIDDIITKNGSFRESLQEGWLTSQVLTDTLAKFTGDLNEEQLKAMGYTEDQIAGIVRLGKTASDAATKVKTFTQLKDTLQESLQSGWAKSWQIVLGDFEEAKVFFTEVSDTLGGLIQKSADSRNAVLQGWKDWGGRVLLIDALRDAFNGVLSIAKPISEAFNEIFPPKSLETLKALTLNLWLFAQRLTLSSDTADKVKRIFLGLFAGLDIVRDVIVTLAGAFLDLGKSVAPSGDSILDFLVGIADFIVGVRDAIKINDTFGTALDTIKEKFATAKAKIIDFVNGLKDSFNSFKESFSGLFKDVDTGPIESFFEKFKIRFAPLTSLGKGASIAIGGLFNLIKKISPTLFKFASAIGQFVMDLGSSIVNGIANLDFSALFDTINGGLLAALILAIREFVTKGSGALDNVSGMFDGLVGILDGVRGSLEAWQQNLKAKTLLTIAGAIGILAASLLVISTIDSKKLTSSLLAITAMFGQLMGSMSLYSKISGPTGGIGGATALIALSLSLLILSGAVSTLAKLDAQELGQSLVAVALLITGLTIFSKQINANTGNILKASIGLMAFGLALGIMADVVRELSILKPEEFKKGLLGVGVLIAEIALFLQVANVDKMGFTKGLGLMALAASLNLMAIAVKTFADMDAGKIQQGLLAIGAVLVELALFTQLSGGGKGIVTTAIGMTILGAATLIFAEAVKRMGDLSWEQIGKGLATMAGSLLIIFGAVKLFPKNMLLTGIAMLVIAESLVILSGALSSMGDMTWEEIAKGLTALAGSLAILAIGLYAMQGSLMGVVALVAASVALTLLAPALATLGSMSITEIGIGLLALAGVFLLLGIAGYALTPVIPTLLGLAASMILIGIATMGVGVGIMLFSAGLATLAVSGTAAAVAIVSMISILLGIIPLVVKSLVDAIILFGKLIIEATPVVKDAIKGLLMAVIEIIIEVTPKLFDALTKLLKGLIQLIRDVVPEFIDTVLYLLGELLSSIASKVPDFVQSGFDILIGFLKGIRDNIKEVVTVAIEIVTEFIDGVADKIDDVVQSGVDLIIAFIDGLAKAVKTQGPALNSAIGDLAGAIISALKDGIMSGVGGVVSAISSLAGSAVTALKTLLGIFSPSRVFRSLANEIPAGVALGIKEYAYKVTDAIKNMGNKAIDGLSGAISNISNMLDNNLDVNPSIRPVVDLTDVIAGTNKIDELLGKKSPGINPAISKVQMIAGGIQRGFESLNDSKNGLPTVSLVQNNYSPKALSRIEIYRQTKNQLATLKGLV